MFECWDAAQELEPPTFGRLLPLGLSASFAKNVPPVLHILKMRLQKSLHILIGANILTTETLLQSFLLHVFAFASRVRPAFVFM